MPIHYAALLNIQNIVVLQGSHHRGNNYKKHVEQHSSKFKKPYFIEELQLDDRLNLVYTGTKETVTAALVTTKEVDKQEFIAFFECFFKFIESDILKTPSYIPPNQINKVFDPLQAKGADKAHRQFQSRIDKFVKEWNDDPKNRTAIGRLKDAAEEQLILF